jgi:hypothetical protein
MKMRGSRAVAIAQYASHMDLSDRGFSPAV